MEYAFTFEMKVRDYECDIQGIVNNAVYQNYLEHVRHEFLLESGIDFAALAAEQINLIVIRAEMDYKFPLRSGDTFWIGVNVVKSSRIKFDFLQDIYRSSDDKLIMKAKITGTAMNERGRPMIPDVLSNLMTD